LNLPISWAIMSGCNNMASKTPHKCSVVLGTSGLDMSQYTAETAGTRFEKHVTLYHGDYYPYSLTIYTTVVTMGTILAII